MTLTDTEITRRVEATLYDAANRIVGVIARQNIDTPEARYLVLAIRQAARNAGDLMKQEARDE